MRAVFYDPTIVEEEITVQVVVEEIDLSSEFARRVAEEIVGVMGRIFQKDTIAKIEPELNILFKEFEYPKDDAYILKLYNEALQ